METNWLILIGLGILAVLAIAAVAAVQRRRAAVLEGRYGTEYYHVVEQFHGDHRRAAAELMEREKRVKKLHLRTLTDEEHRRFVDSWTAVQARFVDDPMAAVTDADRLVTELMESRGYPTADFETRAADISVDHARVVDHYRAARRIAGKNYEGKADTEELRRALVHYRVLFGDLLENASAVDPSHRISATPEV